MGQKLKLAVLLSSLVASSAVLAQSNQPTPAPTTAGNAARGTTQLAQGQGGAVVGGQASGAAATASGAAASAGGIGAAMGVPGAIAAGMTAVGAAGTTETSNSQGTTVSH